MGEVEDRKQLFVASYVDFTRRLDRLVDLAAPHLGHDRAYYHEFDLTPDGVRVVLEEYHHGDVDTTEVIFPWEVVYGDPEAFDRDFPRMLEHLRIEARLEREEAERRAAEQREYDREQHERQLLKLKYER